MYLATAGERLRLHGTDDYSRSLEYKPSFDEKKGIALDLSWSSDGSYFGAVCDGWPKVEIIKFDGDYDDINLYRSLNAENPTSIAFSKLGGGLLAVGNKEGIVSTFNCKSKEEALKKFPSCKHKVTSLDFSSSDSAVAAGTTNGEVYICGIKSGKLLDKRELTRKEAINSVKFHHSRKGIMAAGCNGGRVTIWDINVGIVEKQFLCHESPCKGIVFSPNNITFMASIGYDFVLNFFDIRTKSIIYKSSIPAAGSSLDIHCDGTTLAVGTIRGSVYIYDARKMSSPKENFSSLTGCINRLAFQTSSVVRKRRSRGPQTSLKKQIFKPVQLERTGSSNSSCDSLFSPISTIPDPQKKAFKEDIENSFMFQSHMSSILPREEAPVGDVMSDDSCFTYTPSETPSSAEKLGYMRPIFANSKGTSPSEQMNGVSHLENNEAMPIESYSSGLGTLCERSKTSERSLKVSEQLIGISHLENNEAMPIESYSSGLGTLCQRSKTIERSLKISQAENLTGDRNEYDFFTVSNVMQHSDVSPVHFATPREESRKIPRSSILKTPMKTPRLLDLPSSSIRKMGDGCGETVDNHSQHHNLLSFLEPLNSTCSASQNGEGEAISPLPITPNKNEKSLMTFLHNSECLSMKESKLEKAKRGSERSGLEVEDPSDIEVLDILNKYSISKRGDDVSNASLSFEESEIEDSKGTTPLPLPSNANKVLSKIQESEEEDTAKCPSVMKKYMDEMYKDMCYELKKAMSTMHIFNVSAHAKQEILLHQILSELRKEKVDKCVGTDESYY